MGRFLPYQPDQAYLLPPSVKDELGGDHLCFFIHQAVEHLELGSFEQEYGEEGGALYCPALMLKVWLYGYAMGMIPTKERARECIWKSCRSSCRRCRGDWKNCARAD